MDDDVDALADQAPSGPYELCREKTYLYDICSQENSDHVLCCLHKAFIRETLMAPIKTNRHRDLYYHLLDNTKAIRLIRAFVQISTLDFSQVWQWLFHQSELEGGGNVTMEVVRALAEDIVEELSKTGDPAHEDGERLHIATEIFMDIITKEDFVEFITDYLYAIVSVMS